MIARASSAKTAAVLALTLIMAGCGRPPVVYSAKPLISAEEASAAPKLKPGLWRAVRSDCDVDDSKPTGTWPDCTPAIIVRGDEMLTRYTADTVDRERFGLADGLPMIQQAQLQHDGDPSDWRYYGLRPTLVDGEIVGLSRWVVSCRPQEAPDNGPPADKAKAAPGKGMAVEEGGGCRLRSRAQLQAMTIASEGWEADREVLRWVRAAEQ